MDARVTYHPAMWVANMVIPIYTKLGARHTHTCTDMRNYTNMIPIRNIRY